MKKHIPQHRFGDGYKMWQLLKKELNAWSSVFPRHILYHCCTKRRKQNLLKVSAFLFRCSVNLQPHSNHHCFENNTSFYTECVRCMQCTHRTWTTEKSMEPTEPSWTAPIGSPVVASLGDPRILCRSSLKATNDLNMLQRLCWFCMLESDGCTNRI